MMIRMINSQITDQNLNDDGGGWNQIELLSIELEWFFVLPLIFYDTLFDIVVVDNNDNYHRKWMNNNQQSIHHHNHHIIIKKIESNLGLLLLFFLLVIVIDDDYDAVDWWVDAVWYIIIIYVISMKKT